MPGKTKYLPLVALFLGVGMISLWRSADKPHEETSANQENAAVSGVSSNSRMLAPPQPKRDMTNLGPTDVVDPKDWVENGPKEPLVPPEIHVEAELAPGEAMSSEPLVPPEIHVDVELAPGSSATTEPLTPPVIHVGNLAPGKNE